MPGEIQYVFPTSGTSTYALIRSPGSGAMIWNNSEKEFQVYSTTNYGQYNVAPAIRQGDSDYYSINFPQAIPPGVYNVAVKAAPAGLQESDRAIAFGQINWFGNSGSRVITSESWIITSGLFSQTLPIQIPRGEMIQNFPIFLRGLSDRSTPFTSGIVSGQIARDGGLFTALQSGAITEAGFGFYNLRALTSGDLDGDSIRLLFTGTSVSGTGHAAPLAYTFITQRG